MTYCTKRTASMRPLALLTLFMLLLASCGHKDEKELEQEHATGVVLVKNTSFYEVALPNGESLFFTNYDPDDGIKGLAFSADSVERATSFGTGFFVDTDGTIATNAHVVSNTTSDKDVQKSMGEFFDALKRILQIEYNNKLSQLQEIDYAYNVANYSPEVSYTDFYTIKEIRDNAIAELQEMESTYAEIDKMRPSDTEVKYHNEVSIAYNDTHVTNDTDFIGCVISKVDSEHDLALLQLKDKHTPNGKFIFTVPVEDPFETYSFTDKIKSKISGDKNEKLYLHGFNLGPSLAITEEGLKAQFTNGSVSQHTADRLMYTIPSLPGSSGSPVVNRDGELVAINFAGINGTQSFNYGVRVKHLRALFDK